MKIPANLLKLNWKLWIIPALIFLVAIGFLISAYPIAAAGIAIFLVVMLVTPFFLNNREYLFYVFMLFFAVGEVGVQLTTFLPKFSFSNIWLLYSIFIIFLHYILLGKDKAKDKLSNKKLILFVTGIYLIVLVIYSSLIYELYRGLITQVGYFLVIILITSTVDRQKILKNGIYLAFLSVYILSTLTILTSLGILSFGISLQVNSGLAPWESILPRAIGLPQMDGGNHNVFIVSILPVSIGLYQQQKGKSVFKDLFSLLGIALCIAAVFISLFRSGWLGLITAFAGMFFLYFLYTKHDSNKILLIGLLILVMLGCVFYVVVEFDSIVFYFQQFFFEVRGGGISKRLAQYRFALRTIPSSLKSIGFGFGYNAIRENFPSSPEAYNLRNALDIGLHNHFLGYMYAYGILYLFGYLFIILKAYHWLISDIKNPNSVTRWISKGLLAGLLGSLVILFFTASLSGYKILWTVFSFAAIIPEINE